MLGGLVAALGGDDVSQLSETLDPADETGYLLEELLKSLPIAQLVLPHDDKVALLRSHERVALSHERLVEEALVGTTDSSSLQDHTVIGLSRDVSRVVVLTDGTFADVRVNLTQSVRDAADEKNLPRKLQRYLKKHDFPFCP